MQIRGFDIRVVYDADTINKRNLELAEEISKAGYEDLLVVSILKGSFVFAADLIRALHGAGLSPEVEFISVSSYKAGTESSGKVDLVRDVDNDVRGRDILLIDDILESGRTLDFTRNLMLERGANRVGIAVLLEKPGKRVLPVEADHVGFHCPDLFVVGYGMDRAYAFRELPFVGVIENGG